MADSEYRRILVKFSGEALKGPLSLGIDPDTTSRLAEQIKQIRSIGVEVAVVIGGGNLFRGLAGSRKGMDRVTGDHIGMLATVMNALAMQDALEAISVETRVLSAIEMRQVAETFIRRRAVRHLEKGRVVIFAAGTGCPFFTTDTTAALRASEIGADAIVKATKVDGIYTADPQTNPEAKRFSELSYDEALDRRLEIMDASAFALCRDNAIPIIVCRFEDPDSVCRIIRGDTSVGTLVH